MSIIPQDYRSSASKLTPSVIAASYKQWSFLSVCFQDGICTLELQRNSYSVILTGAIAQAWIASQGDAWKSQHVSD